MDFIELAIKAGIDREKSISVYRRLNGGYYMSIYYARTPIMYKIADWPQQYLRAKKHFPLLSQRHYNEAVNLLVTLDVVSILGASSVILNKPLQVQMVREEVENVFKIIKEDSLNSSIHSYPEKEDIKITQDFFPFISDLVRKREEDSKRDLTDALNDMAYESETMLEMKRTTPWAKTVTRSDSLKALGLSGKMDNFLIEKELEILILAAERTKCLDKVLTEMGIMEGLKLIKEKGQGIDPELSAEITRIKEIIASVSNYI
ncbi:hypothetical protein GWK48_08300 [Metallosphaera tengchongensis]|uniref:Uncharacterized protein n=1 Tax=Metallosphaera tengchongensis TaxID=1532350 RepID=A0A6N0NUG7_9CREN|nr:hypothetical protein [Metallosphaera tengchongensis]QKR00372.1 hypothetical protein GWK48_08300 [Metallosphaera tengchongensis]